MSFQISIASAADVARMAEWAADEGWTVVLSHERDHPIGRLVRDRDRYRYEGG